MPSDQQERGHLEHKASPLHHRSSYTGLEVSSMMNDLEASYWRSLNFSPYPLLSPVTFSVNLKMDTGSTDETYDHFHLNAVLESDIHLRNESVQGALQKKKKLEIKHNIVHTLKRSLVGTKDLAITKTLDKRTETLSLKP